MNPSDEIIELSKTLTSVIGKMRDRGVIINCVVGQKIQKGDFLAAYRDGVFVRAGYVDAIISTGEALGSHGSLLFGGTLKTYAAGESVTIPPMLEKDAELAGYTPLFRA